VGTTVAASKNVLEHVRSQRGEDLPSPEVVLFQVPGLEV